MEKYAKFGATKVAKLLDELSFLSRETTGASFVICHEKESGLWYVQFNNCMVRLRGQQSYKKDFETAIEDAVSWLRANRKPVDVPLERYTLY